MTAISLLLVVLVSLAWIIAGETPGCPLPAKVAAALYFIGPGDAQRMPWLVERTGRWECGGTWVESWR